MRFVNGDHRQVRLRKNRREAFRSKTLWSDIDELVLAGGNLMGTLFENVLGE